MIAQCPAAHGRWKMLSWYTRGMAAQPQCSDTPEEDINCGCSRQRSTPKQTESRGWNNGHKGQETCVMRAYFDVEYGERNIRLGAPPEQTAQVGPAKAARSSCIHHIGRPMIYLVPFIHPWYFAFPSFVYFFDTSSVFQPQSLNPSYSRQAGRPRVTTTTLECLLSVAIRKIGV